MGNLTYRFPSSLNAGLKEKVLRQYSESMQLVIIWLFFAVFLGKTKSENSKGIFQKFRINETEAGR